MHILYFAPIRLYPEGHGNIATVHQYVNRLSVLGHKVHYVYFDEHNISQEDIFLNQQYVDTFDVIKCTKSSFKRNDTGYWEFDTCYQDGLGEQIRRFCEIYRIDVIICTYIMHSKLLEFVPDNILKIIDTHDKMSNRHLALRSNNIKDEFFSCTEQDEARYLSRADIVWARRDEETEFFNRIMGENKAITVSHFNIPNFLAKKNNVLCKIGFLASRNNVNAKMVENFAEIYLTESKYANSKVEIVIAGLVKELLEKNIKFMKKIENSSIKLIGKIEDVKDFYKNLDAVVVPITFGTGINVKMIEAMSFGLPVVSTLCGIKGVGDISSKYHQAKDIPDLVKLIDDLYKKPQDIANLAEESKRIYNKFYQKNCKNFDNCFSSKLTEDKKKSQQCSGCGICSGVCGKNAIIMEVNQKGFYRPKKNSACVNCGICDKVCALKHSAHATPAEKKDVVFGNYNNVYATQSKDLNIRYNASTSGFIRTFAVEHIDKFDAVITLIESDNALKPEVQLLHNTSDILTKIAKSKYFSVEVSKMAEILKNNTGHYLVIALPCQIASLRNAQSFFKGTFFSIELFCGALYSLKFMQNYLNVKKIKSPKFIDFRDKSSGWHNFSLSVKDTNKEILCQDGTISSHDVQTKANDDEFYFAQRNRIFTQEACLRCSYCYAGVGDVQVGDFWGRKYKNDDSGVNLVISRNKKADELILQCKNLEITKCSIRDVYQSQPWFVEYYRRNHLNDINLRAENRLKDKITLNELMYPYVNDVAKIREIYQQLVNKNVKPLTMPEIKSRSFLIITPDSSLGSYGDQAMVLTLISKIKENYPNADIGLFNMYQDIEDGKLLNEGFNLPHYYPNSNIVQSFSDIVNMYTDVLVIGADVLDGGCGKQNTLRYFKLIQIAQKKGKNVQIQGFSFNKTEDVEIISTLKRISLSATLCPRDIYSYERLKQHGCINLNLVADMAFCFDENKFTKNKYAYELHQKLLKFHQNGKKIIGLHLTRNKSENYLDFLSKISSALQTIQNTVVVVLPHDYRVYDQKYSDFEMANLITQEMEAKGLKVINAYDLISEAEVKYVVSQLDILITSRMHIAIAAASRNVPIISFVYQNKFEGLYAMYNFKHNLMFDSNTFQVEELKEAINYLLENNFYSMMSEANKAIKTKSEKNFILKIPNDKFFEECKISVLLVTYNQEKYISQALDSVLAQNLSSIIEIIISDDGSSDDTITIVRQYMQQYPDLIKLIENKEKNISKNPKKDEVHAQIRLNYVRGIKACSDQADCIAVLEGDDYWYPHKIDYIVSKIKTLKNSDDDFSVIFHKYNELDQGYEKKRNYKYSDDCVVKIRDEIIDYQIRNLSCCAYNAKILKAVADRFLKAPGVDHILNLMVMEYAPAYFIAKELSVYRLSANGVWSSMLRDEQLLASINRRYEMDAFLNHVYKKDFDETIDAHLLALARFRKIVS